MTALAAIVLTPAAGARAAAFDGTLAPTALAVTVPSIVAVHSGTTTAGPVTTEFAPSETTTVEAVVARGYSYRLFVERPGSESNVASTGCLRAPNGSATSTVSQTWAIPGNATTSSSYSWQLRQYSWSDCSDWYPDGDSASFRVAKRQTITFPQVDDVTYGAQDVFLGATATSGNGVSYALAPGTTACTLPGNSNKVKFIAAGPCTIIASQNGNANYYAAPPVTRTITVGRKPVTASFTAANKTYDRTTAATITNPKITGGVINGDSVTLTGGTATFADKNAGTGKTVTATGFTFQGSQNYKLISETLTATANIAKATLTTSITAEDKAYDGTDAATVTFGALTGVLGNDAVSIGSFDGRFADKNVGDRSVTASNITLDGADAGNYALTAPAATTAKITPQVLSGSFTAADKEYDGTDAATITPGEVDGVVAGETVALTGTAGTFASADAGEWTVTPTDLELTGAGASNYTLGKLPTVTAKITKKALTSTFSPQDKTYDGETDTTFTTGELEGVVPGDVVAISGGAADFETPAAGGPKTVTPSGFSLSGDDAGNYDLTAFAPGEATINPKALPVTFVAESKDYDGNDAATITSSTVGEAIAGDEVGVTGGTAKFADAAVGADKDVTAGGFELTGAASGNYVVGTVQTAKAEIRKAHLTGAFTVDAKRYDGKTDASITGRSVTGKVPGEEVELAGGTAQFDTKDVGTGKTVTGTGFSLTGKDQDHYVLDPVADRTDGQIYAIGLSIMINGNDKVYDGTTDATFSSAYPYVGVLGGEDVKIDTAKARFHSPNAGGLNWIELYDIVLGGDDAANYTVASQSSSGKITPKGLTAGFTAADKVYDGTDAASIGGLTLTGKVAADDDVALTGGTATFADDQVGTDKDVTATGFALTGEDKGNYELATVQTAEADITPLGLTGAFTAADKVFDGSDAATITGRSVAGALKGDEVALAGGTAKFADAQVGDDKTVTGSGFALAGADKGNYALTSVGTAKAKITPAPVVAQPQAPAPAPTQQPVQTTVASQSATTPAKTKLSLSSFKASSTCVTVAQLPSLKLSYKLSKAAQVTFTIAKRNPSMPRKTCGKLKTVRSDGKYDDVTTATTAAVAQAAATKKSVAGLNTITLKSLLGKKTLKPGTYRVLATATDADGTKTVLKKVVFRVVG